MERFQPLVAKPGSDIKRANLKIISISTYRFQGAKVKHLNLNHICNKGDPFKKIPRGASVNHVIVNVGILLNNDIKSSDEAI